MSDENDAMGTMRVAYTGTDGEQHVNWVVMKFAEMEPIDWVELDKYVPAPYQEVRLIVHGRWRVGNREEDMVCQSRGTRSRQWARTLRMANGMQLPYLYADIDAEYAAQGYSLVRRSAEGEEKVVRPPAPEVPPAFRKLN